MPVCRNWLPAPVKQTHYIPNSCYFAVPAGNNTSFSIKVMHLNGYTLFPLPWCHSQVINAQIKTSILRKPPCWMHHFAPVRLVLEISAWPPTFWKHEFLLSHLALAQTQSPPYVQPGRCLGWKFSTEKAPLVYVAVIYLNSIFLFNCLPLTPGWFTLTPESWKGCCQCTRPWLDEARADSCINHRCSVLIGGIKSGRGHPCCEVGVGASSHIYRAPLFIPPHLPHSVPVHRALSNTGKTHQASAAQWFISYFDEAAGFSPPSPTPSHTPQAIVEHLALSGKSL